MNKTQSSSTLNYLICQDKSRGHSKNALKRKAAREGDSRLFYEEMIWPNNLGQQA